MVFDKWGREHKPRAERKNVRLLAPGEWVAWRESDSDEDPIYGRVVFDTGDSVTLETYDGKRFGGSLTSPRDFVSTLTDTDKLIIELRGWGELPK